MDKCWSSRNIQKGLYLPFGHTKLVQHRSVIHEIHFLVTFSFGSESILAYFHSENDQIFILWLKRPFGDPQNNLHPYQRIVRSSLENNQKTQLFNDLPLQFPKESKYVLLGLLMTSTQRPLRPWKPKSKARTLDDRTMVHKSSIKCLCTQKNLYHFKKIHFRFPKRDFVFHQNCEFFWRNSIEVFESFSKFFVVFYSKTNTFNTYFIVF